MMAVGLLVATPPALSTERGDSAASRFAADRRFTRTRLGTVAYVARGAGPVALFLHGFPLNGFQWHAVMDRLSGMRRCIVPDFLGSGHSRTASGQHPGPHAQLEMLMSLLEKLGVESADVVANDCGVAVAQLMAVRYPGRVRSLLLTNGDTEIESPPAAMLPIIELARRGQFIERRLKPWARSPFQARASGGLSRSCYVHPAHPTDEAVGEYFSPLLESAERQRQLNEYAISLGQNVLTGIHPALRACRIPTRIVWGADDTIFSPRSAHYLANSFGNSRGMRLLTRAKLFWPEERPDTLADQARRLWDSMSARS